MADSINVEDHGMVIVLDGQMAQIYDEGHLIRHVTDFNVSALSGELAEVDITKIVPKGKNPIAQSYEFHDFSDIGEEEI